MDQQQELPQIDRVSIDPSELDGFESEQDFLKVSVDLLVEVGQHICIAACLLPGNRKAWNRNEAILGGLLVRLFKLISAMLDQTCQRRRETSVIFGRLVFECLVNIKYLIKYGTESVFDAFVAYSLRHERRLLDEINRNIAERNGETLPIERRMIASIQRSARKAGIFIDELSADIYEPWKNQSIYRRAELVGLSVPYLAMFGGISHSVHGNWQDLLEYQLEGDESGFTPDMDWHQPRPQIILSIAVLILEALEDYVTHLVGDAAQPVLEDFADLSERLWAVNDRHEAFLASRQEA